MKRTSIRKRGGRNHEPSDEAIDLSKESFSTAQAVHKNTYMGKGRIFYRGTSVASKAELSCIKALEAYCGWKMIEGRTYQVPVGHSKTVDFLVADTLVEFHPIILSREMKKPNYKELQSFMRTLSQQKRFELREVLRGHLLEEYASRRNWTIRQYEIESIARADLIVCTDAESFLHDVIRPNKITTLPRTNEFKKRFKDGTFPTVDA